MKHHRKIECWLADVRKQLDHPPLEGRDSDLASLAWGFAPFRERLIDDPAQIRELITVLRKLRDGQGAGRGSFEEHVMGDLAYLVHEACSELEDGGFTRQPSLVLPESLDLDLRPTCEVVLELCRYAMDCLTYSRPRDSLAGNRRRYALELLGEASYMFEMPEPVLTFVRQILKTGRQPAAQGAIQFCESYYKALDIPVPDDIEQLLLSFSERTTSRGLATGALNVLVESGNISEFTALDRIHEWKQKNY